MDVMFAVRSGHGEGEKLSVLKMKIVKFRLSSRGECWRRGGAI
jgi:hypothetical protein